MTRVKVRDGMLIPLEPLPSDWCDGLELSIEEAVPCPTEADEARWAEIEEAAAKITEADYQRIVSTLEQADREAKEWVRREMGIG